MDRELEQLLKELTGELKGLVRVLGSTNKKVVEGTKTQKAENDAKKRSIEIYKKYKEALTGQGKMTEALSMEFDDLIDDTKKLGRAFKSLPSPMGLLKKGLGFLKDAVIGTGVAMAKTALALSDTTAQIQSLEDLIDQGFGEMPYAGKLLREFSREIDSQTEVFSQLAKSGASFGSSIVMLRKAQAEARMPLGKFTDLIAQNSDVLARLFGTVDQGIPQIAGLMGNLRDLTQNEFAKFGLTLDDTSQFLGTFLELQRARGNVERMTQSQLLQGTREYTKNLITLSKLTGQSVDQLNEQNMAMAADGVFQSQLAQMNADDAQTLSLGISQLPGPLQQLAKEVIGLGAPISDTSRDLTALSGGAFNDAIKAFQNTGDITAFQNSIKSISADVMKNGEAFGDAALAGGGFGEALNAVAAAIGVAIDPDIVEREKTARGDNIVELVKLRDETDKLKAAFETTRFDILAKFLYDDDALINVGDALGEQFKKLSEAMEKDLRPKIEKFGKALKGEDVEPPKEGDGKNGFYNFFGGGDAPLNAFDYMGYDDNTQIIPHKKLQTGTRGFEDFGRGTPAILHGDEMVMPKDNIGDLAKALAVIEPEVTKDGATNNITNNTMDMTQLNANTAELIAVNEKVANHLNTLITIGAMTEKNTKETKNNLANMSGSLV